MIKEEINKHVSYSFDWRVPTNDPMSSSREKRVARAELTSKNDRFYLWLADCEKNHSFTFEEWRELNQRVETLIAVMETEGGK